MHTTQRMKLAISLTILAAALLFTSCNSVSDYSPCELPAGDCPDSNSDGERTCVEERSFQCERETPACVVYRSSDGFCTNTCETDSDCEGDAVCRTIILSTNQRYCVPPEFVEQ